MREYHFHSILNFFVLFIFIANSPPSTCNRSTIHGHLKKLGSHQKPLGVTWAGRFSSPLVFYQNFVEPGKPVLMREVLQEVNHPGLTNWTDDFFSDMFGSEPVKVETSKFENRDLPSAWMKFGDFLETYEKDNVYMVHSLDYRMKDLVLIPSTLHCGGFEKLIQEAVLWMGSRRTSSVLHRDPLDNLLCVFSGQKDVILIDKAYKKEVESDGFDKTKGFSRVDPLQVDFEKFPHLSQVAWHEAVLDKGDCLFIPQGWYHQVISTGQRHVSINLWFSHLYWFNSTSCKSDVTNYKPLEPISTFGFASPNEAYRSVLLSNFKNRGIVTKYNIHELLPNNPTEERANEFFNAINKFEDAALSWSEFYSFDIDKILVKFPEMFNVAEDEEDHVNDDLNDIDYDDGIKNDKDSSKDNLPLPDAVSDDSPSLPDDSVENHLDKSPPHDDTLTHKNDFKENDENQNSDSGESLVQYEETTSESELFYDFVEDSSSKQDDSRENVSILDAHTQKVAKDEL